MNVIFLGAPGAGKGTQAAIVSDEMKLAHIASGDLFRQNLKDGTELGKKAQSYMEQGKLVPDEITIQMVLERIAAPDCNAGVIFDGFPRTLEQAKSLDKAMESQGKKVDRVIYIKVAEEELLQRLGGRWICRDCQTPYHMVSNPPKIAGKCDRCGGELYQRADDNEETVKSRLKVYFAETMPLIDYYKGIDKLVEIAGEGDVQDIAARIVKALREKGG